MPNNLLLAVAVVAAFSSCCFHGVSGFLFTGIPALSSVKSKASCYNRRRYDTIPFGSFTTKCLHSSANSSPPRIDPPPFPSSHSPMNVCVELEGSLLLWLGARWVQTNDRRAPPLTFHLLTDLT